MMHILLLLLASLAYGSELEKRIAGTSVSFSQFPFVVLVLGTNSSGFVQSSCSGSILSSSTSQDLSFVLTLGSCVSQPDLTYTVLVPNNSTTNTIQFSGQLWNSVGVQTITLNPNASQTQPFTLSFNQGNKTVQISTSLSPFNVAVLTLSQPITTPGASAVTFSGATSIQQGTTVQILGYGQPNLFSLFMLSATIIQPSSATPSPDGFLFASSNTGSIQTGDQGGPWMLPDGQIALSSGSIVATGNSSQKISVGILIPPQMDFINSVTSSQVPSPQPPVVPSPTSVPVVVVPASQPVSPPSTIIVISRSSTLQFSMLSFLLICLARMI